MATKTWGPFTGRQLTTIVVAIIAGGVLLPSAVWAVDAFQNVAVEDPVTGTKAAVDASRRLQVSDGSGPLTVDGTVNGRPLPPASPWASDFFLMGPNDQAILAGPSATPINLTNLSIFRVGGGAIHADVTLYHYSVSSTATTCSGGTKVKELFAATPVTDSFTTTFPAPIQLKPATGTKACLVAVHTNDAAELNGSGFYGS